MGEEIDEIEKLRRIIDEIDCRIAHLLNERFDVCVKIASLKKRKGLKIINLNRQDVVLKRVASFSKPEFVELNRIVFSTIMVLSSAEQLKFIYKNK